MDVTKRGMGDDNVSVNAKKSMVFCYYCYEIIMKNINDGWFRPYTIDVINEAITLTKKNTDIIYKKYGFLLKYLLNENRYYKYNNNVKDFPLNIALTCSSQENGDKSHRTNKCVTKYEKLYNKKKTNIENIVETINLNLELNININSKISVQDADDKNLINTILVVILYSKREKYALLTIKDSFEPFIYYDKLIENTSDRDIAFFLKNLPKKYNTYVRENESNNKSMTDFFKENEKKLKTELEKITKIKYVVLNHDCIELRF